MNVHPEHPIRDSQTGFTLVELVIVIVVLGIMSVYAMMKGASPAEMSVPSQAQKLASDIRHTQTLAYTWGKRMRLSISAGPNGVYNVTCITGVSSCDTSNDFSVTLQKDVVLDVVPATRLTLDFNSLGQPSDSAGTPVANETRYTLISGSTVNVSVAPLTGLVTVSP